MYFPSKKDRWLYPVHWGCVAACFAPLLAKADYGVLFFTVPLAAMLVWGWFSTGYTLQGNELIIQSGLYKKKIPINDIKKISPTRNPSAAWALSMDRLEIIYGSERNMALVSPKDAQQFIASLHEINPRIGKERTAF
ncbi:PH domain-containing protein [Bacillus xiapuensis]|uniref:PH domain-containing protein n=1 Tax=Bacillus xiapuensis TaxID=2014075 RepID=UPI000C250DC1|nr:PH domain-containing protein [Bacillus xiapuensis]